MCTRCRNRGCGMVCCVISGSADVFREHIRVVKGVLGVFLLLQHILRFQMRYESGRKSSEYMTHTPAMNRRQFISVSV